MPRNDLTDCPICGSDNINKVLDVVDHFSSKEVFPIFDCLQCTFRFTNHFPTENDIGKYYDSPDYISHSDTKKGFINKLYHAARKYMLHKKVRLVKNSIREQPARLLDIGCGTGYFLHAAKEQGFEVSGIEKEKGARDYAITQFGLNVKDEEHLWGIDEASFDVVTLWHVLEHLEKINESIQKIGNILTENGVAVIAVPNHRSYDASFYNDRWAAYDVPRHLWHFTPKTIEKLLARHGMVITETRAMPLDAFYISLLSEKYRKSNAVLRYGRALLIGLISFSRSLHNKERASSIVYIVRKTKNACLNG